jgi:hypothetical protein
MQQQCVPATAKLLIQRLWPSVGNHINPGSDQKNPVDGRNGIIPFLECDTASTIAGTLLSPLKTPFSS